jgi:hypothetical protein
MTKIETPVWPEPQMAHRAINLEVIVYGLIGEYYQCLN